MMSLIGASLGSGDRQEPAQKHDYGTLVCRRAMDRRMTAPHHGTDWYNHRGISRHHFICIVGPLRMPGLSSLAVARRPLGPDCLPRAGAIALLMRCSIAFVALLFANPATALPAEDPPSLCGKGEATIFSCTIHARTASLCASSNIGPENGVMTYRFGKPGTVELTYPEPGTAPSKAFSTAVIDRGDYVKFVRNGTSYKIYSLVPRGGGSFGGILISAKGKKIADLRCDHGADGLGPDNWALMYKAKLPKDPDRFLEP